MIPYDPSHTMTRMASKVIINVAWECAWLPPPLVSVVFSVPVAKEKEVYVSM